MLDRLICSGEKLLPCPATGCQNRTTRSPSLLLPHHLRRHQFITLCPQLPPFSTMTNSLHPLVHSVVVAHPMFRTSQQMAHIEELLLTCPHLTPLALLLLIPVSLPDDSGALRMVQKPCGTQFSRLSYGFT